MPFCRQKMEEKLMPFRGWGLNQACTGTNGHKVSACCRVQWNDVWTDWWTKCVL